MYCIIYFFLHFSCRLKNIHQRVITNKRRTSNNSRTRARQALLRERNSPAAKTATFSCLKRSRRFHPILSSRWSDRVHCFHGVTCHDVATRPLSPRDLCLTFYAISLVRNFTFIKRLKILWNTYFFAFVRYWHILYWCCLPLNAFFTVYPGTLKYTMPSRWIVI